ncbi:MAG: anthranilate synthase component I [Pseudomonadota bacterium]
MASANSDQKRPSPFPVSPTEDAFRAAFEAGRPQVMWHRRIADLETPVSVLLKATHDTTMRFLLESVTGGEVRGRYSIIGFDPDLVWTVEGRKTKVAWRGEGAPPPLPKTTGDPLADLRSVLACARIDLPDGLPPMSAGLFGFLGYDMVRLMERLETPNPDVLGLPDACLIRPRMVIVFDSIRDEITLVTPIWPDARPADEVYHEACARLKAVAARLDEPVPDAARAAKASETVDLTPRSNTAAEVYKANVERAREYIRAGDIFQVVPSQRFEVDFARPALDLYRSLRRLNPSPFLFCLDFEGFSVVGSSPEILVRLRDETVTIRPIAGTRPRGATPDADRALERDLIADPKERAEHLMLLDLGRNDVGRVADIGSVTVTEEFIVERYSHVMHIVSNVEGHLQADKDAVAALMAGFPAGTVSGAPKIRAMEIIDELEGDKRGLYGGAIGYFSAAGDMDTCIALRTAILKDGKMFVQAGGGVVADSDPEFEYQETVNKAMALIRAAEDCLSSS